MNPRDVVPADGTASEAAENERLAPVTYLHGHEASRDPQESEIAAVPDRQARRAENVSLSGLTRRNMSRWELERLLRSRELSEEAIEQQLEKLERAGLVDDAALAETLVRTQHERKGLGKQAIIAELRRRHIDQELIEIAIASLDVDDEKERAFTLAEKRAGQLSSYDSVTAERRLTAFLMRKGYSSAIVREAVQQALRPASGVRFH